MDTEAALTPSRAKLGHELYNLRNSGIYVDIAFELEEPGGHVVKILAHKMVLVAMSSYMETRFSDRWTSDGKVEIIPVPKNVGKNAVEYFLRYLYLEQLSPTLDDAVLLEVLFLADHYLVSELAAHCDEILLGKLSFENCVEIYQYTRNLIGLKTTAKAYIMFTSNVDRCWQKDGVKNWEPNTWREILSLNYLRSTTEIKLFQNLLNWKNVRPRDQDEFNKLVTLIRFPLMDAKEFAEFVVPSGILGDKDIIELFVYFAGKGGSPKFSSLPRNILRPRDSTQLMDSFATAQAGDRIQLTEPIYYGQFMLSQARVILEGVGRSRSILESETRPLTLDGRNCTVSGISVHCIGSEDYAVLVDGEENELYNVSVCGGGVGVRLTGSDHKLRAVSVTKCSTCHDHEGVFAKRERVEYHGNVEVTGKNHSVMGVKCAQIHVAGRTHCILNCTGITIERAG